MKNGCCLISAKAMQADGGQYSGQPQQQTTEAAAETTAGAATPGTNAGNGETDKATAKEPLQDSKKGRNKDARKTRKRDTITAGNA